MDVGDLAAEVESLRQRVEQLEARLDEARFVEMSVERVNVVESDGSLRMTLSNGARTPDPVVDGETYPRSNAGRAGLIFFNDEGDECGGLSFGGRWVDGQPSASALLAFDQFKNDQAVAVSYGEVGGRRISGLTVWDHSTPSSEFLAEVRRVEAMPEGDEKQAAIERLQAKWGEERLFAGRLDDGAAGVVVRDGQGKVRLRLLVEADGTVRMEVADEEGNTTSVLR